MKHHPENKFNIQLGQTIFFTIRDSRGRMSDDKLVEGVVATIGKKYFTVTSDNYSVRSSRFYLANLIQDGGDYSPQIFGYVSKQDILDKHEMENGIADIRRQIGNIGQHGLSIAQIRSILAILNEKK